MKLQTAIVGLPNVGKSTLFNALTQTQGAEAANYPFCTIEPNVGIVEVPDVKLAVLSNLSRSEKVTASPAQQRRKALEVIILYSLLKPKTSLVVPFSFTFFN